MDLNPGQTASFTRTFTQEDFDRFAVLSGDDNPIHVDPQFSARTRFGRTVAHGMFLYSQVSRLLGSQLPGPGTLQIEQEMIFPTPTYTGEEVAVQAEVLDLPGKGLARLSTRVIRPVGEIGLEGSALVRLPGSPPLDPARTAPLPRQEISSGVSTYKNLFIGQSASLNRAFSYVDLEEYVSLTGDANPLYFDLGAARSAGLPRPILPGPLLGGLISYLLGTHVPGRGTNWLKQKLIIVAPAHPNQMVTARVTITRLRPEKDLVNLRTTCFVHNSRLVCDGEALVYVRDLEDEDQE